MDREEREKAIDLLDNLRGMIEDNQGNDYDFALKKGIEALKHEQGSDEMTIAEYRHRMMQTFLDTDCDELIALCVLPTEKEFEHLKWVLEKYFKQEQCEDVVSREKQETEVEQFARWVATEIFSDMWGFNKDAFAELACRKLAKLGIVEADGDEWKLVDIKGKENS